ncbi:IS66 family insertion sequence element accessory protein TnpB [Acidithiobacillus ferrooxidans]|uniref:IS66 family insertion sequence element accessory protein TnpB n=1 Tax=Acidithiobacillus ferrooxidans TaxID=920 RepID=UPI001C609E8C|nr:IS66 family insertion sequence element accessory protein TnpB [Acidithiobacillus ferrooxidans]
MAADPFAVMLLSFATAEDRLKLLLWDGLGFWLVYRRLDQGRLHWPRADAGAIELSAAQWAMLVEGRPWTPLPSLEKCTPTLL